MLLLVSSGYIEEETLVQQLPNFKASLEIHTHQTQQVFVISKEQLNNIDNLFYHLGSLAHQKIGHPLKYLSKQMKNLFMANF